MNLFFKLILIIFNCHGYELDLDLTKAKAVIFPKSPSNSFQFQKPKLTITVNSSAGAQIYLLPEPQKIKKIIVKGRLTSGSIILPNEEKQGDKGKDDFVFRLGVITKGLKRLNWIERQIAPAWMTMLQEAAPKDIGLKHINFHAVANKGQTIGKDNFAFLSSYFLEDISTTLNDKNEFELILTPPESDEIFAFWLGADGDDTKSNFVLEIYQFSIEN